MNRNRPSNELSKQGSDAEKKHRAQIDESMTGLATELQQRLSELESLRSDLESRLDQHEQISQQILDVEANAILVADPRTKRFVMGNKAICDMLGYSADEIPELGITDISPERDLPYILAQFEKQSRFELSLAREIPVRRKNGSVFFADIFAIPLTFSGKQVLGGVFQDVSDRHRAGQALLALEQRHRLISDNVTDLIWTAAFEAPQDEAKQSSRGSLLSSPDELFDGFRFAFGTPSVEQILGYDCEEFVHLRLEDLLTPASLAVMRQFIEEEVTSGLFRSRTLEIEHVTKGGKIKQCEVTANFFCGQERLVAGMVGVTRDISEWVEMKRLLVESEERHRLLLENLPDLVGVADRAGRFLYVNHGTEATTKEEMLGLTCFEFVCPEHRTKVEREYKDAIGSRQTRCVPFNSIDSRHFRCRFVPIVQQNKFRCMMVIGADLTEQFKAEAELQQSELWNRSVLQMAPDGIVTVNDAGQIELFNPAAERIFGYSEQDVVGRSVEMLMPPRYRTGHENRFRRFFQESSANEFPVTREVIGRRKDGSNVPLELSISVIQFENRQLAIGIVHDVSKRRRLEREMSEFRVLEQQRIGRDLHDGLGQELMALAYQTEALRLRLAEQSHVEAEAVEDLAGSIHYAIDKVHAISKGLAPVEAGKGSLIAALNELADTTTERYGVSCRFKSTSANTGDDISVNTHLFHIAQEAVTNATKHGKAKNITIGLDAVASTLTLLVRDDGIGFRDAREDTSGMGLRNMRYRSGVIGAALDIFAPDEGGTVVQCVVQLEN